MLNKKAQGMPMNVIIIAIIVLVVLIILIAFFAGGFGKVVGKVGDLFSGQTSGQARDTAIQTCQNLCDTALELPEGAQTNSGYCKQSFLVDHDSDSSTKPRRMSCGFDAQLPSQTAEDQRKGIEASGDLGVPCPSVAC